LSGGKSEAVVESHEYTEEVFAAGPNLMDVSIMKSLIFKSALPPQCSLLGGERSSGSKVTNSSG